MSRADLAATGDFAGLMSKGRARHSRYNISPKGRARQTRYNRSQKGKATRAGYMARYRATAEYRRANRMRMQLVRERARRHAVLTLAQGAT